MFEDDWVTIHHGDAWALAPMLEPQSVHTIVTSPPYWRLRDYGEPGQFGLEVTPEEYVARLVDLFALLRPALRDDGTVWLNLGDSFAGNGAGTNGLKSKDLVGMPWRVAFALQADGWYLRSDIIWHKPNPMPESVTDRPTKAHEYVFLLSKQPHYYYDAEAIKEPAICGDPRKPYAPGQVDGRGNGHDRGGGTVRASVARGGFHGKTGKEAFLAIEDWRNKRDVWTVATRPFSQAHFAVFPPELIEPCILAGAPEMCCPDCGAPWLRMTEKGKPVLHAWSEKGAADSLGRPAADKSTLKHTVPRTTVGFAPTCDHDHEPVGGTVLDPFLGSGTTAQVARSLGRRAIGFEMNASYIDIAAKHRLAQGVLL
jgi:DNA modification methylase